jgi:hypothetical protein
MQVDDRGLVLSTTSAVAAAHFNAAVRDYLEYRLSAMDELKQALAADPGFALAHCLRGCFLMLIGTTSTHPGARKALAEAERCGDAASERERAHIRALRAWVERRPLTANAIWERLLLESPRDVLALRLQHFNAFWLGRADLLRDVPASVLSAWEPRLPGYGNVLGMLAFGLEECGDCRRAERLGREAVERNSDDLWAIHAVAHVLETEERYEDGCAWLNQPSGSWTDRNPFKDHLWWHRALYALERGDDAAVLELYDREIQVGETGFYLDVQNAASLLMRLELVGVRVGDRWERLADVALERQDDHVMPFTDAHYMMALVGAGRLQAAAGYLDRVAAFGASGDDEVAQAAARILLPVCRGLLAFARADYRGALDALLPVRHDLAGMGASHAQRDVFAQLTIEAALRAGRQEVVRRLVSERQLLRPGSRYLEGALTRLAAPS